MRALPASFYQQPTVVLAKALLGKTIHRTLPDGAEISVRITETEAYHQDGDEASHSFRGRTERNAAMFGPSGCLYVYLIYGVHFCFNVVSEEEGIGAAVLIRAAEPLTGIDRIKKNRNGMQNMKNLLNGPGKLAQALQVDKSLNRHRLDQHPMILAPGEEVQKDQIEITTRIGISKSKEKLWRFVLKTGLSTTQ